MVKKSIKQLAVEAEQKYIEDEFRANLPRLVLELIAFAQQEHLETKIVGTDLEIYDRNYDRDWSNGVTIDINTASRWDYQEAVDFVERKRNERVEKERLASILQTAKDKIRQALTEEELAAFKAYCENTNDVYL